MKKAIFLFILCISGLCHAYDRFFHYNYLIHLTHLTRIQEITEKYDLTEEDQILLKFHIDGCKSFIYELAETN